MLKRYRAILVHEEYSTTERAVNYVLPWKRLGDLHGVIDYSTYIKDTESNVGKEGSMRERV